MDSVKTKVEYFFGRDWTASRALKVRENFAFWRGKPQAVAAGRNELRPLPTRNCTASDPANGRVISDTKRASRKPLRIPFVQ